MRCYDCISYCASCWKEIPRGTLCDECKKRIEEYYKQLEEKNNDTRD